MLHHLRAQIVQRNPHHDLHPVIKKIAEAFRDKSDMSRDPRVRRAFDAYQEHSERLFRLIDIPVLFVDYDPYPDAETSVHMRHESMPGWPGFKRPNRTPKQEARLTKGVNTMAAALDQWEQNRE